MSEASQIVWDTATRLFAEQFDANDLYRAEAGEWLGDQWRMIDELGLPLALVPEDDGGVGLDGVEAARVVRIAGAFAVPLPLAETMLANRLLAAAGLPLADGPACVAPVGLTDRLTATRVEGGWRLAGVAHRIPWGRVAAVVVAVVEHDSETLVMRLAADQLSLEPSVNLALEPRDTLRFDAAVPATDAGVLPGDFGGVAGVFAAGAALKASTLAGAADKVLEMSVGYANERVQFGKPIGKFQAIQQSLAVMAGQVAACAGASDLAAEAMFDGAAPLAIAVGKARTSEAAGVIAGLAHQVHGAIGFTHEHSLHFFTKRLWSWREEFGNEAYWNRLIGRRMLAAGADGVWPLLTNV